MKIAQFSDLHITRITWNPLRFFSKRMLGNLNWIFSRKNQFSEEQIAPLPDLFASLGVDLVLFGGDFSTTSMKEEFEIALNFMKKFKMPILSIPGNHDSYTYRSHRKKHFYDYFTNTPLEKKTSRLSFFSLKDHRVEVHPLKENFWLILLDTTRATSFFSSRGHFSKKTESYLKEIFSLLPENCQIIILNHYPFFQNDMPVRNLERGPALEKLIKQEKRIVAYLHGHTHRHIIADLSPSNLPLILDSGSAAQRDRGTWNLIELSKNECQVTPYRFIQKWEKAPPETIFWRKNE